MYDKYDLPRIAPQNNYERDLTSPQRRTVEGRFNSASGRTLILRSLCYRSEGTDRGDPNLVYKP